MTNHLFEMFRERMPSPETSFIETSDGARITYGAAVALSGRLAHALVRRGIAPGDRIAVQIEKSPQAVLLYLAAVRCGAIFVPLNTAYTLAELEYFIGDCEPQIVVCAPDKAAALASIARRYGADIDTLDAGGNGSIIDLAKRELPHFEDVARTPDDLVALLYTSGTTGRSKGAMLTHGNLASNAATLRDHWHFTREDRLLHALPIFHTHGLFVAINVTLMAGSSMLFLPKFDADTVMRLLHRVTCMMGVPTFYVRLAEHPALSRETTQHMRLFVSGSAPLLKETHAVWKERTGHAILERYGMTETNMIASNPYDGPRIAGAVGQPLPGVEVRITDPGTGALIPQGDIGMIEVKGPNVFAGYWRNPEKTKADFRTDGFFITGDLGRIDEHGYLFIVGRGKDLIISGGYNVYPKEIEAEIDGLAGVIESAVIGIPHRDLGEGVTAIVVAKPSSGATEQNILAALRNRLAKFKLPKYILFVDALPRNAMGKVQKNILRESYSSLYSERR
jgi:malonyl-CoA/methylmalonyl-CoA synthetase